MVGIVMAMKRFQNFNWSVVIALYPREWMTVLKNMKKMQGDSAYLCGLNNDELKISNYRTFLYVAANLLYKHGKIRLYKFGLVGKNRDGYDYVIIDKLLADFDPLDENPLCGHYATTMTNWCMFTVLLDYYSVYDFPTAECNLLWKKILPFQCSKDDEN